MVTEVVMTMWIRLMYSSEKVKDQDVDAIIHDRDNCYENEY